jgi:hypothetical protein
MLLLQLNSFRTRLRSKAMVCIKCVAESLGILAGSLRLRVLASLLHLHVATSLQARQERLSGRRCACTCTCTCTCRTCSPEPSKGGGANPSPPRG